MESLANQINLNNRILDTQCNILGELLQQVPASITIGLIKEQAEIVINLRELRDILKEGLTGVNRALVSAETHLCRTIADNEDDGITYQHPKATITASARGFFEINEPHIFYNWLAQQVKNPMVDFVTYASSKTARKELCEGLLMEGGKLPPGIKEHIVASVIIRRKTDG